MREETKPRPAYFVQSPSYNGATSYGLGQSPIGSPVYQTRNHSHHDSPSVHQFSDNIVQHPRPFEEYTRLRARGGFSDFDEDEMDGSDRTEGCTKTRLYCCMFLLFLVVFTMFCLILWGVSKAYRPIISLKGMVFENIDVQAGIDDSGVATDMLTLNSTVRIFYRNSATYFSVHVPSTPLVISYFQLILAHGQINSFNQKRNSETTFDTVVEGNQVPLYGGIPKLASSQRGLQGISLPLNLTFTVRSTAPIMGILVKSNFRSDIRCLVTLQMGKLGKFINSSKSCSYKSYNN